MKRNAGSQRGRAAIGALGVLAVVALAVPPAEARVRVSIRSTPRPHVSPSVPKPHVPEAPKVHLNVPSGRPVSVSTPSAAPAQRGFFGRFWDWMLGRKPAPAPAPQVAQAAPAPANVVVPFPSVQPSGGPAASLPRAHGLPQDQDAQRTATPGGAPAAATTAGGPNIAAALNQAFGTQEAQAAQRNGARPVALTSAAERPTPKPSSYVLHLANGSRISVPQYEERGDQVVVAQRQGSYGIPRSQIVRIETQAAGLESAPTGPGER